LPPRSRTSSTRVELKTLLEWADEVRKLGVWANADYPKDAIRARRYGAQGIGLCRTEHMFFEEERLPIVQEMIMATSRARRQVALDRLLPVQRGDFEGIFRAMDGLPVIIRLLDPPLHEFLPSYNDLVADLADLKLRLQHFHTLSEIDNALATVRQKEDILNRVKALSESNPMLGLRGDRLSVVMPEITEMQVRAILEAAIHVKKEGIDVHPEIMVPLAGHVNELKWVKDIVDRVAQEVFAENGGTVDFKYGSMIEIPRAALTADELADRGRVLQLRHQRPDADHLRHEPRRRRVQVPHRVHRAGRAARQPVPDAGPGRRGQAGQDDRRTGPQDAPRDAHGHLRRARRRPQQHRVLPHGWSELRKLQPVPGADCAARSRAGGHQTRVSGWLFSVSSL
jgi:hypothetical protein